MIEQQIKQICEFIKNFNGYYIYSKQINEKDLNIFFRKYPYYEKYIKIFLLVDKLFFIDVKSYNILVNRINSINEIISDSNINYVLQQLKMDNIPISFIQYLIKNIKNSDLIYKDKSIHLIIYS